MWVRLRFFKWRIIFLILGPSPKSILKMNYRIKEMKNIFFPYLTHTIHWKLDFVTLFAKTQGKHVENWKKENEGCTPSITIDDWLTFPFLRTEIELSQEKFWGFQTDEQEENKRKNKLKPFQN